MGLPHNLEEPQNQWKMSLYLAHNVFFYIVCHLKEAIRILTEFKMHGTNALIHRFIGQKHIVMLKQGKTVQIEKVCGSDKLLFFF